MFLEPVAIIATTARGGRARRSQRSTRACGAEAAQNLLRSGLITLPSNSTWNGHRTDVAGHSSSKSVQPSTAADAALKRVLGEPIDVEADVIAEGHERIACVLLHAPAGSSSWTAVPMTPLGDDVWHASFVPAALGRHRYTVAAWIDAFATWRHKFMRRTERDDVALALREGAALVRAAAGARARRRAAARCSRMPRRSTATSRSSNAGRAL